MGSQEKFPSTRKNFSKHKYILGLYLLPLPARSREGGGERVSPAERRQQLLEVLCLRRHDTYGNLANEFNVCKETIRHDIEELMRSYPVETIRGRHGGGVRVMDDMGFQQVHLVLQRSYI